jgi:hypothetical protein
MLVPCNIKPLSAATAAELTRSPTGADVSWWKQLWRTIRPSPAGANTPKAGLTIPGWSVAEARDHLMFWRDADGDVLSLAVQDKSLQNDLPSLSDEEAVRRYCRKLAESGKAGLVEAATTTSSKGPAIKLIYKKLQIPAFRFTGMLIIPLPKATCIWSIVAGEHGMTGVREAVVTAGLMNEGKLTVASYEASWAQDPYDSSYCGVDRSTLRYLSDDEAYDQQFPQHALSKVRRELHRLASVEFDQSALSGATEKGEELGEPGAAADGGRDAGCS